MTYTLDLSIDELTMLKNLLNLLPTLQGATPEDKTRARNLLNYLNNVEEAKKMDTANCDEAR